MSIALLLLDIFFEWVVLCEPGGESRLPRVWPMRSLKAPEISKLPRAGEAGADGGESSLRDIKEESEMDDRDFLCRRFLRSSRANGADGGSRSSGGSSGAEVSIGGSCGGSWRLNT